MTVGQFLNDSMQELSGIRADSCAALKMLNRARELLYPLDDWDGTVEYGVVRGTSGCFYLPWSLETPRTVWTGNQTYCYSWYWHSIGYEELPLWCERRIQFTRTGIESVLPFSFTIGSKLGLRLTDTEDIGTEIEVAIQNPSGSVVSEKIQLTELVEPTFAETVVGEILGIKKPSTNGNVEIWCLTAKGHCSYLYSLQAKEENPKYRQFSVNVCCPSLVVKAKKKFFNYSEKDIGQPLDITSPSGLRFAIQAIDHERNKKYNEYSASLKIARSHLERKQDDIKPNRNPAEPFNYEPCFTKSSQCYGSW